MPSALDSVRPIGVEDTPAGGTQTYGSPTELDGKTDAVAAAGLHLIGPSALGATDKTTYIDRTSGGLRLTDSTTQRLLSELMTSVAGGVNEHAASRDLQHFLAGEGPGPGFASGAYFTRTYNGILPLVDTWWASNAQATKILTVTRSYTSGSILPSSVTWAIYTASGVVARTLTDSLTYNGVLIASVTRVWS